MSVENNGMKKGEGKEGGEEGRKEVNVARIGILGLWFWIF